MYSTYFNIVDDKLEEAIWKQVSGLSVGTIANAWHQIKTLEPTTHTVINTLWFAPAWLYPCGVCVCMKYENYYQRILFPITCA